MVVTANLGVDEVDLMTMLRAYNDVTEKLKRSHETLAHEVCLLRDQLEQKNRELARGQRLASLGRMAAGVAHEIRNPLGGIGLYASLLEKDLCDRPKEREIVRKMTTGVRNVENIVRQILAFAGEVDAHPQQVGFGRIIDAALAQVAPQADAGQVEISVDTCLTEMEVYCDARQIERALINLLLNALDAVPQRGHVWLRRVAADHGVFVSIAVEDDGPGFAPETADRIFDPFFTTRASGTGLGLAIVHRIAEANGGSIVAGRRDHGGAVFVLSIPAKPTDLQTRQTGGPA